TRRWKFRSLSAKRAASPAIPQVAPPHVRRECVHVSERTRSKSGRSHPASGHPPRQFPNWDSRSSPASQVLAAAFPPHLALRITAKSADNPHPSPARNSSARAAGTIPRPHEALEQSRKRPQNLIGREETSA